MNSQSEDRFFRKIFEEDIRKDPRTDLTDRIFNQVTGKLPEHVKRPPMPVWVVGLIVLANVGLMVLGITMQGQDQMDYDSPYLNWLHQIQVPETTITMVTLLMVTLAGLLFLDKFIRKFLFRL